MKAVFALSPLALAAAAHAQCLPPPANFFAHSSENCDPVIVNWDIVDGAEGYRVEREPVNDPGHIESLGYFTVFPIEDAAAALDVPYYYYVTAIGACGEGERAGPFMAGRFAPASPTWVGASDNQDCDVIYVEWDTSTWAPEFAIYRSLTNDLEQAELIATQATPPYEDRNVLANTGYTYWVAPSLVCGVGHPVASDIGYSNYGMEITRNPESLSTVEGRTVSLSIEIRGFASFEWYRDGELVTDNARISGADTRTITFSPVSGQDSGSYYAVAYGGCGSRQSQSADLLVFAFCPADFNHDRFVDFFDYADFVEAFETGNPRADFNLDNFVDFFDYADFVAAFETGC